MARQQPLQFTYNTNYNFSSFHAGCNQELVQQLQLCASGKGEQQIFIWGQQSQGKSHLLQACCHAAHNLGQSNFYLALAQTQAANPNMLSGLENIKLVCIDDIQAIAGDTAWEQAFFRFYNLHREQGNHLIIASSAAPVNLNIALPDFKTRLAWGLCLKINTLNDEQRIAALVLKARTMGLEITPRTGQFLLSRCARDFPSLWALLDKIDYATLAAQRKPTIPLIKQILKQKLMKMKVLVVGAGAIGGFYGALLAKQGAEVSVVCRSDYEQVKQQGIVINSHNLGSWNFKPAQVLKNVSEYKESTDYILLCTKVINSLDRVKLIASAVKPETTIVFIQNGVEIEQELLDAFPDNEIISGLAFICSNRTAPGVISHQAYGRLFLGNASNGISSKTQELCNVFNQSGITCRATEDIITARWQKCIWNAPFNPLSVLSDGLLTLDILQTQETFVRQIMQEVFNVAAATGHPLPPDTIAKNIANTYNMPPYKTSMLLDFEAGRPMETDAILGNTVKAGRREKVPCPCLESIYALMQLKELKLSQNH